MLEIIDSGNSFSVGKFLFFYTLWRKMKSRKECLFSKTFFTKTLSLFHVNNKHCSQYFTYVIQKIEFMKKLPFLATFKITDFINHVEIAFRLPKGQLF